MQGSDLVDEILAEFYKAWAPPPVLSLSQWAERYAYLSQENSAEWGKWHNFPYQVGIMDAVTDPRVREVTVMKSSRIGYTKIIDHVVGYHMHQDPCPIMIVQPTIEDAEDYSKTEIEPMIRDTPVLIELVGDAKAKDSKNTIMRKSFPGGRLIFVGANSPRGFRRVTVRIVCFDEIDGYPIGAGQEGDQIKLGINRTLTFWNNKIIAGSTPTIKDLSRIEKRFNVSDQRYYFIPCPHCKTKQRLKWEQLKWPKGKPELAEYQCEQCGQMIPEKYKKWMLSHGEWRATAPFKGHAGFHIWSAYSLFPNAAWGRLAEEFLDSKDDAETLQVFVNTVLGNVWEEKGERVEDNTLMSRREIYGPEVPDGAAVLTAGVDVQVDRVEVEVVAWGLEYESWNMDYRVIYGDPETKDLWDELDEYLLTPWTFPDGKARRIAAVGVDTGYLADEVYKFCKPRIARRVYALKGKSRPGESLPIVSSPSRNNPYRVPLFTVGVDVAKDLIYGRLKREDHGPGYCHFPPDREIDYFKGLTAEKALTKYRKGRPYKEWHLQKGRRNEPLDCRVYALSALTILKPNIRRILEQLGKLSGGAPANKRARPRRVISSGVG